MSKIIVLLSTFNGERYLRKQIESVLSQKNVDVYLLVRDDGSTDSTRTILQKYEEQGALSLILGENIGWRRSFMELVYAAPIADYYAFCDQDDIWLPEKLSTAVSALEALNKKERPILYGSNLFYYKDGKVEGKLNLNPNYSKQSSLVRTLTCGCTLVFNKELQLLLEQNRPKFIEAHDSWVFMTALYLGEIIYDPNAYILYRQHDYNQIGAKTSFLERLKRAINAFKHGRKQCKRRAAEEFLNVFNRYLSDEDKLIVSRFANYTKGIGFKIRLLLDNRYTMGKKSSDILLKLKILTNKI